MSLTRNQTIQHLVQQNSLPPYRQTQIFQAIYKDSLIDYSQISTLPKTLREQLTQALGTVLTLKPISQSQDKQAQKILFQTRNGKNIEAVKMTFLPNKERPTEHTALCVSSQSGCAMGCKFCATGTLPEVYNLTEDEIGDQYLYFKQQGMAIETIFFSGMGEPFANPNFGGALHNFTAEELFNISPRRLSVSTVGIVPGIQRLTKDFPQVNLAISLHSPFNEQRLELMPITKTYSIEDILQATDEHIRITNRKVFIAYILLGNVTDSLEHAKALADLIKSRGNKAYLYHVNLIRYHPTQTSMHFGKTSEEAIKRFEAVLTSKHVQYTVRQDFGINIEGACGQLAANYKEKPE